MTKPDAMLILSAARIRAEELTGAKDRDPDARCAFADSLEAQALATVPPEMTEIGIGQELIPAEQERSPGFNILSEFRETLKKPSYVTADASRARLEEASQAGVLTLSLDIAETIGAKNSVERMLAAQMALLHKATMKLGKRAVETADRAEGVIDSRYREALSNQAVRCMNAFARGTAEFQGAALTLQKLKTGGRQVLTVQHVTVKDGGQAVVAQVTDPRALSAGGDERK